MDAVHLSASARIAVVSDTHMPRMARTLPTALRAALEDADAILHAGDWVSEAALVTLEAYAPVIGVAGNNDDAAICARFPSRQLIAWGETRIGLVHGHEGRGRTTPDRALAAFEDERVHIVVFGHSHIPLIERRLHAGSGREVLLVNPGSPTDKRRQPRFSFAWLTRTDGESSAEPRATLEFFDSKN